MKIDFAFIDSIRINTFLRHREGERKIGEHIFYAADSIEQSLDNFKGEFVLLGVEEDIGPRANLGNSGAMYAFKSFLSRFLNMQDNRFVDIENIMILGRVKAETLETGYAKRRKNVEELDAFLQNILLKVYRAGKIPILVGGGHNNAYPLMAAYKEAKAKKIDVVNLDAHADYRLLEGRHSGNSFTYARQNNFLESYTIHGLHSAYINEQMLGRMDQDMIQYTLFENYLGGQNDLKSDALKYAARFKEQAFGIELDMDAIAFMPSSAYTPSGFTINEARIWLRSLIESKPPAYVNLTEGACELNTWSDSILGKSLAYLVYDIISKPS